MSYGEIKAHIQMGPKAYGTKMAVHAATHLNFYDKYDEGSTTILLRRSKAASLWRKKNPAPVNRVKK